MKSFLSRLYRKSLNLSSNVTRAFSTGPAGAGKPIEGILATCMDANIDGIPIAFPNHHKMRFAGATIPEPGTCPQIDNSIAVATTDNFGKILIEQQKMVIVPHGFCKATRMSLQGLITDSVLEIAKKQDGIIDILAFDEAIKRADEVAKHSAIISIRNAKLYGFKEENLQSCFFNYFTNDVLILDRKNSEFRTLDDLSNLRDSGGNKALQKNGIDPELLERLLDFRKLNVINISNPQQNSR